MDRRAFIGTLAGGLLVHPLVTEAQREGKVWRIGLISVAYMKIEDSFFQELRKLGYVEGQNLSSWNVGTRRGGRSNFRNLPLPSLVCLST